jgi:hypothetical protein
VKPSIARYASAPDEVASKLLPATKVPDERSAVFSLEERLALIQRIVFVPRTPRSKPADSRNPPDTEHDREKKKSKKADLGSYQQQSMREPYGRGADEKDPLGRRWTRTGKSAYPKNTPGQRGAKAKSGA